MKYTVACIGTNDGWQYKVFLWNGNVRYEGTRLYKRFADAEKAAKSTGATLKDES